MSVTDCESMAEVPNSGEYHRYSQLIGGFNDFLVVYGSSGLDYGGCTSLGHLLQSVGEWEVCIRSSDRSSQWKNRFHGSETGRIHPAHLFGTDANLPAGARVYK